MTRNPTPALQSAPLATLVAVALLLVTVPAGGRPGAGTPERPSDLQQDKIANAMSAAPDAIARNAAIMDWPTTPGAQPRQLRAGTNGWVCYPSSPAAVSAAVEDPMCLDKPFQAWAQAWMSKTRPTINQVGIAYMLRGDAGVSNTDPFAMRETASNQWIRTGPHIMVLDPDPATFSSLPTDPNNGGPWVMWKGTPYVHIMVPLGPMPAPMHAPAQTPASPPQNSR